MADFATQRLNMVESQVRPSDVTDRHLMRIMQTLPRELFLPVWARPVAYSDEDVPVRRAEGGRPARCLLAPRTLAKLVQAAEINSGDHVLDIGCATGYSTAVLAGLCAHAVGLEDEAALVAAAGEALRAAKIEGATIEHGALAQGWRSSAPYDVVVLNGSVPEVPAGLFEQLKDGGRLVAIVAGAAGAGSAGGTSNGFGAAHVYFKRGNAIGSRIVFDAGAPLLPGFERLSSFAF